MPAYSKSEAETELATWKAALKAVAGGQAYTIASNGGSRSLTRANLSEIREMIQYFSDQVDLATRSSKRPVYNVVPLDC